MNDKYIKLSADMITNTSVGILKQEIEIIEVEEEVTKLIDTGELDENNEPIIEEVTEIVTNKKEKQVSPTDRRTFINSTSGREMVQKYIKNIDGTSTLFEDEILPIWGDNPTIITEEVDIEKIRIQKQAQIKQWCHNTIINGIDIDLGLTNEDGTPRGSLHYTLTEQKQTDMRDLMSIISTGASIVTWKDDSRLTHEIYSAELFTLLYQACTKFIFECRFKSDGLEELLFTYDNIEDINNLTWDTEIPENIQNKINELLIVALGEGD